MKRLYRRSKLKTIWKLLIFRAIETCAGFDAHLWAPNDENDMKLFTKFAEEESIFPAWIGVIADPPNWYALEDWLSAGCDIVTEPWVNCRGNCFQENIIWQV